MISINIQRVSEPAESAGSGALGVRNRARGIRSDRIRWGPPHCGCEPRCTYTARTTPPRSSRCRRARREAPSGGRREEATEAERADQSAPIRGAASDALLGFPPPAVSEAYSIAYARIPLLATALRLNHAERSLRLRLRMGCASARAMERA